MKKLILVCLVLSVNAFADIDNGIYRGTTTNGQSCEVKVLGVSFRNGLKHPVNEQVAVESNGEAFTLGHATTLINNSINIQGEFLSGYNGIKGGVTALQIAMVHTEAYSGPKDFRFVLKAKDSSLNQDLFCQDLKFVE